MLSEEGVSGNQVGPNCVSVADLSIYLWISNDLITRDSTIGGFLVSKPDRNEWNEKRGRRGSKYRQLFLVL